MVGSSTLKRQIVRVLDADGTPLTSAVALAEGADGAVILTDVETPGTLVHYFFGRGERLVVLELPDLTFEGTLETWWTSGERAWQVYIDRPLVMLEPAGWAHPVPAGGRR